MSKEIKRAKAVAAALAEAKTDRKATKADQKVAKKSSNQEKIAKSPQEYERKLHQDGVWGGNELAQARARQRHFDSTGQRVVRHPGMPDVGVKEDDNGAVS